MRPRTPNLFLVGAMRSGTTALHEALDRHRDIAMSGFKEPAYFADPVQLAVDSPIVSAAGYAGDRDRYLGLFSEAGPARYVGESSTHYTKLPRITGVAGRIADFEPQARILYLVRDPVERTLSHYRFALKRKYERRHCLEALRADPIYCSVSNYAMQLQPYLDYFGTDQTLLVVLEELAAEPETELRRIHDWLDLESTDESLRFARRNEVAAAVDRARGPALLHRIGRAPAYRRLAPAILPSPLRLAVRRLLNRPVGTDEVRTPEVLDYLRTVHAPHVAALETLTGRRFPSWTSVHGG